MSRPALLACLSALFFIFPLPASALYKCEQQGHLTYSDSPCSGKQIDIAVPATPSSNHAAEMTRAQSELRRLQNSREQKERQDQQYRNLALRGQVARQKKCRALALQSKWKQEDANLAPLSAQTRSRRIARRAEEKYQSECSDPNDQ
jgi:hypothetical protein